MSGKSPTDSLGPRAARLLPRDYNSASFITGTEIFADGGLAEL